MFHVKHRGAPGYSLIRVRNLTLASSYVRFLTVGADTAA